MAMTRPKNKAADRKRAQVGATFETLPKLFGFNEQVILRGVRADTSRGIVYFYFAGPGLEEYEDETGLDLTGCEGQESKEIIPPVWLD